MNGLSKLWNKLARSKRYRAAFVAAQAKRGIPTQIRALRKERGWTQAKLATSSDMAQGVVSRAEDPDYGNLTLNTIVKIAAGFDVAFVGKFVAFSEFAGWHNSLSERSLCIPKFEEDHRPLTETEVGNQTTASLWRGCSTGGGYLNLERRLVATESPRIVPIDTTTSADSAQITG